MTHVPYCLASNCQASEGRYISFFYLLKNVALLVTHQLLCINHLSLSTYTLLKTHMF